MELFWVFLSLLAFAQARPQENLREVVEEAATDLKTAIITKAGAVAFAGSSALDFTVNATGEVFNTLDGVDLEAALNDTEDAMKQHKVSMIETLFDLKRQLIRGFSDMKNSKLNALGHLYTNMVGQIEMAIETTATGMSISNEYVNDIADELELPGTPNSNYADWPSYITALSLNATISANNAVIDTQNIILDTVNSSVDSAKNTAMALIYSMLGAKKQLHDLSESIDSQQLLHNGTINIALALNSSLHGVEEYAAEAGVFNAMDSIVHGFGQIPHKINGFFKSMMPTDSNEEEQERPKRDTIVSKDMTFEELDNVLKQELAFWNALNEVLAREMRMIENEGEIEIEDEL